MPDPLAPVPHDGPGAAEPELAKQAEAEPRSARLSLHDHLLAISREARPVGARQWFIYRPGPHGRGRSYLSGIPYLWTGFGERAFIFADEQQARGLIEACPDQLAFANVDSWERGA